MMSTSSSESTTIREGPYTFQRSSGTLHPFEVHLNSFKVVHFVSWTLWLLQIIADFSLAYQIQQHTSQIPWKIWIGLMGHLLLTIPELLIACTITLALCTDKAAQPRPDYKLQGDVAPTIDILITSCGEPLQIVINTLTAAAVQDYPSDRFRILVLDDGHDTELRYAVNRLSLRLEKASGPAVVYLSRTVRPGQESYFKSGNLRFGIEEGRRFGERSEFLAGLDADMIPEPDWLKRMVPHLLVDDQVAIAAGPQRYYNVPPFDPLGQQADFEIFFSVQELLNDCVGGSMCTGTGYVARRSAIGEIGGWPLAYSGEDYMCSAILTGAGWKVAFVRSYLQTGLAPESLTTAIKQRMRWTDAGIEVHQRLAPYSASSILTSRMKPSVSAVNSINLLRDYAPLTTFLGMLLLPLVLMPTADTDDTLNFITTNQRMFVFWAQTLFFTTHLASALRRYFTYKHLDLSLVGNVYAQELWSAPYSAYRCIISLLSLLPLPARSKPTFTVSGALVDETSERSSIKRATLRSRLTRIDILLYFLYVLYASMPLIWRLEPWSGPPWGRSLWGFAFPSLLLREAALVRGVAKPVLYMIWPPTTPEWEDLVCEGEDGVKRPRKEEKGSRTGFGWFFYLSCELAFVLACLRS